MLFQVVHSVLLSMVALITTYMKESDWLLKNFHHSENSLKSYHGEQNWGYHLLEHKNYLKLVSKVTLHFVWGHYQENKQCKRWLNWTLESLLETRDSVAFTIFQWSNYKTMKWLGEKDLSLLTVWSKSSILFTSEALVTISC